MSILTFDTQAFAALSEEIHASNVLAGWWSDKDGNRKDRNVGELLMLVTSELAEAAEGDELNLLDDKLPHRKMIEVELADTKIRIHDMDGGLGLNLGDAIAEISRDFILLRGLTTAERLMLCVRHVAHAMEGDRKKAMSAEYPNRLQISVGLARCIIEMEHLARILGLDVDGAIVEKRAFNAVRADHQLAARAAPGGKTY
jgi:hypothetical protein